MQIRRVTVIGLGISVAWIGAVFGQETRDRPPPISPIPNQTVLCPPDVKGTPPTLGGPSSTNLSDKLSDSKGIICPPAVDPEAVIRPPPGGELRVIPPPGSPAGDPTVQPK